MRGRVLFSPFGGNGLDVLTFRHERKRPRPFKFSVLFSLVQLTSVSPLASWLINLTTLLAAENNKSPTDTFIEIAVITMVVLHNKTGCAGIDSVHPRSCPNHRYSGKLAEGRQLVS